MGAGRAGQAAGRRGYVTEWFRNVYACGLEDLTIRTHPTMMVREVDAGSLDEWLAVIRAGHDITSDGGVKVSDEYARAAHAIAGATDYLAEIEGNAAGCGSLVRDGGVGWLGGATTHRPVPRAWRPERAGAPTDGGGAGERLRSGVADGDPVRRVGPQPVAARIHTRLLPGRDDQDGRVSLRLRLPRIDDEADVVAAQEELAADDFVFAFRQPGQPFAEFVQRRRRPPAGPQPGAGLGRVDVPARRRRRRGRRALVDPSRAQRLPAREGGHIGYAVRPAHRRRGYATEILRQSLIVARAGGVERALVTCDDDNVGSATVIEPTAGCSRTSSTSTACRCAATGSTDRATMGDVLRRAIVLFVPPPVCEQLDEIRRRWDPVMCGRIGCHITLVHDVTDHARAAELVAAVAATTAPFTVRLGRAAHWGKSAWGVYLHVDDPAGAIDAVQAQLAELEEPGWARVPFRSHATLMHGRTTPPETRGGGVGGPRGVRPRLGRRRDRHRHRRDGGSHRLAHRRALRAGHGGRRGLTRPRHDGPLDRIDGRADEGDIDDERGHAMVPDGATTHRCTRSSPSSTSP